VIAYIASNPLSGRWRAVHIYATTYSAGRLCRKMRQSPIFNGWTDDNEPNSPVAELFGKLVPFLQRLKRQRGALRDPPLPPYPEMKGMPAEIYVVPSLGCAKQAELGSLVGRTSAEGKPSVKVGGRLRAALSDASCSSQLAAPVGAQEVFDLAHRVRFSLGHYGAPESLPIEVEELGDFDAVADAAADDDRLVIVDFFAEWCGPCKQVAPVFRQFSVQFGTVAVFLKADIDSAEALAARFSVQKVPTILFLRGGSTPAHVQGRFEGGGAGMAPQFMETLQSE
jgi:thioredoxin 1